MLTSDADLEAKYLLDSTEGTLDPAGAERACSLTSLMTHTNAYRRRWVFEPLTLTYQSLMHWSLSS